MGSAVLIDGLTPGTVQNFTQHACFFKHTWDAEWEWVPWVRCKRATESASPEVPQASFIWNFGENKQHFDATFQFYLPVLVLNSYVMVRAYNAYGNWPVWIGVVQEELGHVHGTTWPQGDQAFEAFGLEHLLDRNEINGAFTESGFIERTVYFNRKDGHGLTTQGNRSADPDAETGTYYFSRDGEKWSNLQIIQYLLARFVNDGIKFKIMGATEPLDEIVEEHNFHGQTVLAALNQLIDRRYGLNWRLLVPEDAGGIVYVYVYSQLAYPLHMGDIEVPANPVQSVVPILGDHAVDPIFRFSSLNQFDSVEVRGDNLLVCGTFSYADGTLVKGWTDDQQNGYDHAAGADEDEKDRARRAEAFDVVYQKHIVPRDWDGKCGDGEGGDKTNAFPTVEDDGEIQLDVQSVFWNAERKFENEIPIEISTLDPDAPIEYRRAFAIMRHPDTNSYSFVEKAWFEDETVHFPGNVSLTPRELGVMVRPEINHLYGLNHVAEDIESNIDAAIDYETLIVTAAFRTDAQMKARGQVPGQVITETGRTKIISVPEAQYWVILPNTVTDVVDGALYRQFEDQYEVVRDDHERLQQILALALVWFGFARGTLTMTYKNITPAWPTGGLILAAEGTWHATTLGTPVTKKEWNFETNMTEICTGSDEVVFKDGVMRMKKAAING